MKAYLIDVTTLNQDAYFDSLSNDEWNEYATTNGRVYELNDFCFNWNNDDIDFHGSIIRIF